MCVCVNLGIRGFLYLGGLELLQVLLISGILGFRIRFDLVILVQLIDVVLIIFSDVLGDFYLWFLNEVGLKQSWFIMIIIFLVLRFNHCFEA